MNVKIPIKHSGHEKETQEELVVLYIKPALQLQVPGPKVRFPEEVELGMQERQLFGPLLEQVKHKGEQALHKPLV